jgi:hypothetical protein
MWHAVSSTPTSHTARSPAEDAPFMAYSTGPTRYWLLWQLERRSGPGNVSVESTLDRIRAGKIGGAVPMVGKAVAGDVESVVVQRLIASIVAPIARDASGPRRRLPPLPANPAAVPTYLAAVLPDAPPAVYGGVQRLGNPQAWAGALYRMSLDGSPRPVEEFAAPLFTPSGFGYAKVRFFVIALVEYGFLAAHAMGVVAARTDEALRGVLDWLSGEIAPDPQTPHVCLFGRERSTNPRRRPAGERSAGT